MRLINIFRAGTHTSSAGDTIDFSDEGLQAAVNNYDPAVHQAPIVVGHPKTDDPAFGWIKSLEFRDGNIYASPEQVNPDFEEMVQNGTYKKVSASWYLADAPNNPKPGALYLRHVGFLGAQPPAIKGLEAIQFNEDEQTVEFNDTIDLAISQNAIARAFKSMREFIIDKFSKADADDIIPDYLPEEIQRASERAIQAKMDADDDSINPMYSEEDQVTLEQLQAENDKLKQQIDTAATEKTTLEAQLASFQEQEAAHRKAHIEGKIDSLIEQGKATPAQRDQLIDFAQALEETGKTMEFGEGEQKQEFKGADALIQFLASNKPSIDFQERSKDNDEPTVDDLSAKEISQQAHDYAEKHGVSFEQAVTKIMKPE